jgi:hypothetical protein
VVNHEAELCPGSDSHDGKRDVCRRGNGRTGEVGEAELAVQVPTPAVHSSQIVHQETVVQASARLRRERNGAKKLTLRVRTRNEWEGDMYKIFSKVFDQSHISSVSWASISLDNKESTSFPQRKRLDYRNQRL